MKIAVILQAFDQMSSVINPAFTNAREKMRDFQQASKKIAEGGALIGAGYKLAQSLEPAIDAFKETQAAGNELKASMMTKGGVLDESTYKRIYALSNDLSDKYKGSASSYLEMVTVLKNNRINEQDILGGIGDATAKLADYFKMTPASIGEFAAHMKNDMSVGVGEMNKMMDMIARVHNAGVGKTGEEAVTQMNEFFSKASLGAANLGVQGIEASKQLGSLGALFMSRGLSGATVGTNFRRIFDGLRDIDKVRKANEVAKQFGVSLDLFGQNGQFKGIDNFVQQMGKMQNLSPQNVSAIFKAFGGKQGLSTDFLEYLGKEGLKGFSEFNKKIDEQATLDQKLKAIMDGLEYKQGVMKTSWFNLKAAFGATLEPTLNWFYDTMNNIITSVRKFVDENPKVAQLITTFLAISSVVLVIVGVIKAIQGIGIAMKALKIAMSLNPFVLWATLAIAAVSFIIVYWDDIVDFFKGLWEKVKKAFSAAWNWIKQMFLNYTPQGLIIKHWSSITAFFTNLWNKARSIFSAFWNWLKSWAGIVLQIIQNPFKAAWEWITGFGGQFFQAGKNIAMSIYNGLKSAVMYPVNKVKEMVQKIRNLLPFSPAKDGPLRDIHRIRLVETIAESIKPNAMLDKMRHVSQLAFDLRPGGKASPVAVGHGGNISINPTFHFNLSGTATKQDSGLLAREMEKRFGQMMKNYTNRQNRISFG